jgi:hypothetical protein
LNYILWQDFDRGGLLSFVAVRWSYHKYGLMLI